jgi:nucleoside-specific outer membrane channel protein Tsx
MLLQLLFLCLLGLASTPVFSASPAVFDWTTNDIQLLYGSGFRLGPSERATVTVEHANTWKYGSNYFFADIVDRSDIGVEIYSEVYTYLSFNKISGNHLSVGPLCSASTILTELTTIILASFH